MRAAVAPTTGIQRGRGGFYRSADDAPYVTDPTGELVKSGPRAGEVCRLKYGSFSKTGTLIENDVGLTKYKQRNTLLGIGMSVDLVEACRDLVTMDAGGDEFRKAADTIVVEADNLTRSWLAADRGSHGHWLCELHDKVLAPNDLDIEKGEALGISEATQRQVMIAWASMLATNGLKVLAVEASCVDDRWKLAGTLDRIVRCTRELRFATTSGELVIIPAGTILILDIKFGKCRLAHAIQVAGYRQAVPYDTETEVRGEWPWEISADHALIAKGDFGGDGIPPSISLVWVDLAAGRDHGGECVAQAKAWAARDDLFSVAQLDDVAPIAQVEVEAPAPDRLAIVNARSTLATNPDQGADLADGFDELWAAMYANFTALDEKAKTWRGTLVGDATRAHVPFHVQEVRTERTYHLNKGIIALAAGEGDHDEILRALLALVLGEVAYFPGVDPGHALGSLTAAQAETFASFVDAYFADGLTSSVDPDGHLVFAA